MAPVIPAVAVALALHLAVLSGLIQHVRVARAGRRDLDRYLRWLLDEAAGPLRP